MKGMVWCAGILGLVLAAAAPSTVQADPPGCDEPKVGNFILFDDQSGSMYQKHGTVGEVKQILAKRTMLELNQEVPTKFCCLDSGLYLFAPFEELKVPYVHDQASFATRIGWIPDSQPVALRLTPMADGFEELSPVVSGLEGKTAVIVVTDGGANTGGDGVEAARALVAAKPGTCLHVVSVADGDAGRAVNAELAKITPECRSVEATEILGNAGKMQQFAKDVFCITRPPLARRGG